MLHNDYVYFKTTAYVYCSTMCLLVLQYAVYTVLLMHCCVDQYNVYYKENLVNKNYVVIIILVKHFECLLSGIDRTHNTVIL